MAAARSKKSASRKSIRDAGKTGGGRKEIRGFILRFVIFSLTFSLLPLAPGWDRLEIRYLSTLAFQMNGLLHLIGEPTQLEGTNVFSTAFRMTIEPHCSALGIILFYSAAVLAFPASMMRKIAGLSVGFIILYALNMVRIATIYLTGAHWPARLQGVHEELWPSLLIMGTLLLCGAWVYYASKPRAA